MSMIVPTPADRAAQSDGIARRHLHNALAVTGKYTGAQSLNGDVLDAAWACRLLIVGALTDALPSSRALRFVRSAVVNVMHDGTRSGPVVAVYRAVLNGLDGKG